MNDWQKSIPDKDHGWKLVPKHLPEDFFLMRVSRHFSSGLLLTSLLSSAHRLGRHGKWRHPLRPVQTHGVFIREHQGFGFHLWARGIKLLIGCMGLTSWDGPGLWQERVGFICVFWRKNHSNLQNLSGGWHDHSSSRVTHCSRCLGRGSSSGFLRPPMYLRPIPSGRSPWQGLLVASAVGAWELISAAEASQSIKQHRIRLSRRIKHIDAC